MYSREEKHLEKNKGFTCSSTETASGLQLLDASGACALFQRIGCCSQLAIFGTVCKCLLMCKMFMV